MVLDWDQIREDKQRLRSSVEGFLSDLYEGRYFSVFLVGGVVLSYFTFVRPDSYTIDSTRSLVLLLTVFGTMYAFVLQYVYYEVLSPVVDRYTVD